MTRDRTPLRKQMELLLALVFVGWAGLAGVLDRYGQRRPGPGDYEAIVVAGCRVLPDGRPSLALARRTDLAVDLWRQGQAPVIVFTGGLGEHAPTEAAAAAARAVDRGVPLSAIQMEDRSTSTEENASFSAALGYHRVLLVTDAYHVFRAERTFLRYFDDVDGVGSVGPPRTRAYGALREVLAIVWYAASGRI